jgi:predicted nucleic acid-binding protein
MSAAEAYMLDTHVFDRVLDGRLSILSLKNRRLVITGIQRDELNRAKEPRRTDLLATVELVDAETILASSFAWDIEGAGFNQAFFNDGAGTFERMRARLQQLDRKNKKILNQERDILIAETAIKTGAILISDDRNLCQVVSEFGGRAIPTTIL